MTPAPNLTQRPMETPDDAAAKQQEVPQGTDGLTPENIKDDATDAGDGLGDAFDAESMQGAPSTASSQKPPKSQRTPKKAKTSLTEANRVKAKYTAVMPQANMVFQNINSDREEWAWAKAESTSGLFVREKKKIEDMFKNQQFLQDFFTLPLAEVKKKHGDEQRINQLCQMMVDEIEPLLITVAKEASRIVSMVIAFRQSTGAK